MSKESSGELLGRINQARKLLDEAIALMEKKGHRAVTTRKPVPGAADKVSTSGRAVDFSMPIRAFVKRYGLGMNGARKFVLLVAYCTKGDSAKRVSLAEIERQWNKMTGKNLLGMKFNGIYSVRAREHAWVNTEKAGSYHLRPEWREILQ